MFEQIIQGILNLSEMILCRVERFFYRFLISPFVIMNINTPYNQMCVWVIGNENGKDIMHVRGIFSITNNSNKDLIITGAWLDNKHQGQAILIDNAQNHDYRNILKAGDRRDLQVDIIIPSLIKEKGKEFMTSLKISDQFNRRSKIKNIIFKYMG